MGEASETWVKMMSKSLHSVEQDRLGRGRELPEVITHDERDGEDGVERKLRFLGVVRDPVDPDKQHVGVVKVAGRRPVGQPRRVVPKVFDNPLHVCEGTRVTAGKRE